MKLSTAEKSIINYSQCWEDAGMVLTVLDIQTSDTILSISSGGCNTLSILSGGSQAIYAIDSNPAQTFLAKLKHVAIQRLTYTEYLEFIGVNECFTRFDYFNKISPFLDNDCRQYFYDHKKWIKMGVIHCGKFENYLKIFRKFVLPLLQSQKTIMEILQVNDKNLQYKIYNDHWNKKSWRIACKLFFSEFIMQLLGRHRSMFRYNANNQVGKIYLERLENALSHGVVYQNPYLEYILTGNYRLALPLYLQEEVFLKLKDAANVQFITADILGYLKSMPEVSISKFNLSDVFESVSEIESYEIFSEILRTALNGARLIFWNNLVDRDVPAEQKEWFVEDKAMETRYRPSEMVFFYNKFFIYTIKK